MILKRNPQRFFSADFRCESAWSHHFAPVSVETGSLVGFVILRITPVFFSARQKTCSKLLLIETSTPPPPPLPLSPSATISSRLHHSPPLSRLASSTDRSCPLSSSPPPLVASRRVVPRPHLSRLRRRSEGTAARSDPSSSSSVTTMTLRVARPPPLVAPSNICSRSRQCNNIAAPAIVAAARRTSILAKNAAPALLLARGTSFPTAAVTDAVPPHPKALPHTPPQQHVDCHFHFKA